MERGEAESKHTDVQPCRGKAAVWTEPLDRLEEGLRTMGREEVW